KIRQLQMSRDRCGLVGHAFHQVAIAAKREDVEVEQFETWSVEMRAQPARGDGHADAVAAALAEWPRRALDAGSFVRLRMPRRPAMELTELLELIERHGQFARRVAVA